jgi:hypothetical protein
MDLQAFRNDKSKQDYYKSSFSLTIGEGRLESFVDNLEDAFNPVGMEKGETKELGTICVYCVDATINKVDDSHPYASSIDFEGEKLIMITYDENPDDTFKLRYVFFGCFYDDVAEIESTEGIYYLDSYEQENPLDYWGFEELYAAVEAALEE